MTILQLNPPLPVITPKGAGLAHLVLDYGIEYNLIFTVILNESGEIWSFPNKDVRGQMNITLGREEASEFSNVHIYDLNKGKKDHGRKGY